MNQPNDQVQQAIQQLQSELVLMKSTAWDNSLKYERTIEQLNQIRNQLVETITQIASIVGVEVSEDSLDLNEIVSKVKTLADNKTTRKPRAKKSAPKRKG